MKLKKKIYLYIEDYQYRAYSTDWKNFFLKCLEYSLKFILVLLVTYTIIFLLWSMVINASMRDNTDQANLQCISYGFDGVKIYYTDFLLLTYKVDFSCIRTVEVNLKLLNSINQSSYWR